MAPAVILRGRQFLWTVLVEDLPGGPVERPDIFLVLLPDRVRAGGETNQRIVPGRVPGLVSQRVLGRGGYEITDQSLYPIA
jgi:hypothetical protein